MGRSEDYEETRWDYSSQTYHSYRDYDKAQILHVSYVEQKLRSATVKIAKSIHTRGHFYFILPTRETATVSLKAGSSCPSFFMDDKRSLSHSQKPRGTQRVYGGPASSPAIFLSLTPPSDVRASFTQAASIYGQPAANSSTVTLHGPAQGARAAPERGKTHRLAASSQPRPRPP